LASCDGWELRYEIPNVENCVILSSSIFCINPTTGEEFEMEFKDAVGFKVYSPDAHTTLYTFATSVMLENVKLSKCRDRRCIKNIVRNSEFGQNK